MAQGVDEAMLDIPGQLSTSANPSTNRMCMVYGHRNRIHLRILEKVEHDDAIIATMSDGTIYTYTVTDIQIYENSRSAAVDRRKNHLTCDFLSVVSSFFRKKVCGVWQEQSQPATEVSSGATSRCFMFMYFLLPH